MTAEDRLPQCGNAAIRQLRCLFFSASFTLESRRWVTNKETHHECHLD